MADAIGHDLSDVTRRRQYQTNLEEALDRAETASRARTSFLANMSHEMRTPLNGVISMTDLLTETKLDHDQQHYVYVAKSSAEHLLQLIDDILDVSKLEADQVQFETIAFDIQAVVTDALEITAPKAHEKSLDVGAFVSPRIPRQLIGDPGRIRQILINIIGNGIKFTSKGHVHMDVDVVDTAEGKAELQIVIEDTGIGIAADKIPALFRDFSQVDSSISRRYGGTGLGLSICRKLVNRMGGSISVESEAGVGTRFKVRLPMHVAKAQPEPLLDRLAGMRIAILSINEHFGTLLNRQIVAEGGLAVRFDNFAAADVWMKSKADGATLPVLIVDLDALSDRDAIPFDSARDFVTVPVTANAASAFAGASMDWLLHKPVLADPLVHQLRAASSRDSTRKQEARPVTTQDAPLSLPLSILVAEDNVTNQFAIRRILENMGATVVVASNGLEAVEAVQRDAFDIVLMDMMMPEMDGLTATRTIRALESSVKDIPIVALTANAFKEDQAAALESGMNGYTTKPTNRQKLHTAVTEILAGATWQKPVIAAVADDELDSETFDSFVSEMGEDAPIAIDQFIQDIEARFGKMMAAHHEAGAVERDSHAIKSAAGMLGLRRLAKIAAELEARCRKDRSAEVASDVAVMQAAFQSAREVLKKAA